MAGIAYRKIIEKIDTGGELTDNEKLAVKEAVDDMFTRYSIGANGIVSMIKLTADRKAFSAFREIIERAAKRRKSGRKPLTSSDKNKIAQLLSYLKQESAGRIIKTIEGGTYTFLYLLSRKLKQVDVEEIEKLQRIIKKL